MKYLELTKSIKLALMSTFIPGIIFLIIGNYLASGAMCWAFLLTLRLSTVEKALRLAMEENKRKKTIIEKLMALTGYYN